MDSDSDYGFDDDDVDETISIGDSRLSSRYVPCDQALPLLVYNMESRQYDVSEEALRFIRSIEGPIGVISVAGMYRTGKSYLLNRMLLDQASGFGVGPTINPCTKGMWIWGRSIPGTTVDGERCNVLIIDTEGLGALDEDSNHDARIFSLAILFSSSFIYNSVGSIDENALQNLSLVVNLTNHIQIKSQAREVEAEDFAQYFPSFTWVVRDFVLQLVDSDGEPLTSAEYLERALAPQKGYSDAVEEKNRIRRLLKNFFKDRDCFTMVRPTTEEEDLQKLNEKEFEQLRPEFVEQVLTLRRKMINKVRPKMLNGKPLNGSMLATLVDNYVTAVNSGIVPNIENAWTYICADECKKAYQTALQNYDRIMRSVSHRLPVSEDELKMIHKEAKEAALDHFEHRSVGPESAEYLRDLKEKMADNYDSIRIENEELGSSQVMEMLEENYKSIEQKLKAGEFEHYLEYEKQMRNFQEYFLQHGPEAPNVREMLFEYLLQKQHDAGDHFFKHQQNELQLQTQLNQEKTAHLEKEMHTMKEDQLKEKDEMSRRLISSESEKAELAAKENSLSEQLNIVKADADKSAAELQKKLNSQKKQYEEKMQDVASHQSESAESNKELERKLYQTEAEFNQEKALLTQKISFHEKTIADLSKRENEYTHEINDYKKEYDTTVKDVQSRYENQIQKLQQKYDQANERALEAEKQVSLRDSKLERKKFKWSEETGSLQKKVKELALRHTTMKAALDNKEGQSQRTLEQLAKEHEENSIKLKSRLDESENKLALLTSEHGSGSAEWEKVKAVLTQKVEFLQMDLEEKNNMIEENKKHHERMVTAMQDADAEERMRQELEDQIVQIKEKHSLEMKAAESDNETKQRALQNTVDDLNKANNDLELKMKLENNDKTYEIKQLSERVKSMEGEKSQLQERLNSSNKERNELREQADNRLKSKGSEMESAIEEVQERANREIAEINTRSEESLAQLKAYYEEEKSRLEKRLKDEKERYDKKLADISEDYEQRMNEETENLNIEIQGLEDELDESRIQYEGEISALQQTCQLNEQKIETLESYLKEAKSNLSELNSTHSQSIEQQIESFNKERATLLEKVEKLASDLSNKDREYTAIKYKAETLENTAAANKKELEEIRVEFDSQKSGLTAKIDQYKQQNQTLSDELLHIRSDTKRETALSAQQAEYMTKRITDLETSAADSHKRNAEKTRSLREELTNEYSETIEKLNNEKQNLENKMEEKRKQSKEAETTMSKQIIDLEKERAVNSEKLSILETKKVEVEERYKKDIDDLQTQLKELKESENSDKMSLHLENERLKTLGQELDKELQDRNMCYERDKSLWENKFNFLSQQRDQARTELQEQQKKFDVTLSQLQKKGQSGSLEQSTTSVINAIENKYKIQISDMNENFNRQNAEITEKLRNQEAEYRILREEIELERRGRSKESGSSERQIAEAKANEEALRAEIDILRNSQSQKIEEIQKQANAEKQQSKVKHAELDKRIKEMEHARGQLFLEHEKERAKWNLEKDQLISARADCQDTIERLQKKSESLIRENEKHKADRNTRRGGARREPQTRPGYNMTGMMSFEDFAKVKESTTGTATPSSMSQNSNSDNTMSPSSARRHNFGTRAKSPISRELRSKGSSEEIKRE